MDRTKESVIMKDRWMIVSVAGLGWNDLEQRNLTGMAGFSFQPADSAFPAVTCTAQASFRTAATARQHGMTSNGTFSRSFRKATFWEQAASLVEGPRIWDDARRDGRTVGLFFWQQSLGECVDSIISPAPIHKHGGGMIMENYTRPAELGNRLKAAYRSFPLNRYWGPLASPKVGHAIVQSVEIALDTPATPDIAFVYLPTLDYDLQRHGPSDPRCTRSFTLLASQLTRLSALAERQGRQMLIFGDYAISPVTSLPAFPNATLRKAGFFNVRHVRGMAYPDIYSSLAFALVDHEIAHVYIQNSADLGRVRACLEATNEYESVEVKTTDCEWGHASAGELLLTAKAGSWCAYPWWTNKREAPDYATHVDIHAKPGYDPCELFFGSLFPPGTCVDASRIRGTHGRHSQVAFTSSKPLPNLPSNPSIITIAQSLSKSF